MNKELELELQEIEAMLDEQLSNDPKEDYIESLDDAYLPEELSYPEELEEEPEEKPYYEEPDYYEEDADEIEMRAQIEQEIYENEFRATHGGLGPDRYYDQCHNLYIQYGIPSQYNIKCCTIEFDDYGGYEYDAPHLEEEYESLAREAQIQDIIKEGYYYHNLTLNKLIKFCEKYLNNEEILPALKYYAELSTIKS